MDTDDLFRSCCAAIDRLLDGVDAPTSPEMSENERALAIIQAARRDHSFTEDFWQRYRRPDGLYEGGSRSEHYHKARPEYRAGTGTLHTTDTLGGEATMRRARRKTRHTVSRRRHIRRPQKQSLLAFFCKLFG